MLSARNVHWVFIVFACCLLLIGSPTAPSSAATVRIDTEPGKPVHLLINRLAKLKSSENVIRAHVVNPDIAEIIYSKTQSPEWVFISGKSIGTTQLTLWGKKNRVLGTFEIIVRPDVNGLKKHLHDIFPQEKVNVRDSGEYLTLTGTVSGAVKLTKVMALAEAYAPERIINLLQVGGVQQVMLEVRIAEISKSDQQRLGINIIYQGDDGFGISKITNLISRDGGALSTAATAAFKFIDGRDSFTVGIDALQEDGLLQILAKPTLIAQSGQSASFLAGGEFPYPVQEDDSVTIEWKPFGVGLNFTPTVLGDNRISLLVSPEVSELDFTRTVQYNGFTTPSVDTRRMSTVVELADNQSFVIAGLLKNYVRESVSKLPILGDLPIIGALFRSTKYRRDETELVVIVTPHLVKPVDGDDLPLPTDSFIDPKPFELLLLGMLEGKPPTNQGGLSSNTNLSDISPTMEGDFGYIIPE